MKEIDHVDANYAAWIAASPFCVLGTVGPEGLDCSPRGDAPGFVRLLGEKTLLIPDRRGKLPKLVLVVSVESVFFQCSRALVRSRLWDAESHVAPGALPTPGQLLADLRAAGPREDDAVLSSRASASAPCARMEEQTMNCQRQSQSPS